MKERGKNPEIEALWQLAKAVRCEVNDPENNLKIAKQHLQSGSILLYDNHFSILDTSVIAKFIESNFDFKTFSVLAGRKHFDKARGIATRLKSDIIESFVELKGFNVLQVVQKYETEYYKDSREFNLISLKQAVRKLNTDGQILAISPEGTRSRSNGLIRAEDGMEMLFRLGKNKALALPIAMHPYKIIPPFTKTIIEVGTPFSYREIEMEHALYPNTSITDLMMGRLASLLPEENRGYYSKV